MGADQDGTVLRLSGELDLSGIDVAVTALRALDLDGSGRLAIDLRELTFIDSTGIAFLVHAHQQHGERLRVLRSDSEEVVRILRLTGLEGMLSDA